MAKKSTYEDYSKEAIKYGAKAENTYRGDPIEGRELYGQALDAINDAINEKPGVAQDQRRRKMFLRRIEELSDNGDISEQSGKLEQTLAPVIVAGAFIFALDLLAPKITGNVVGSGNFPVDMGAGLVLLVASIAAMVFLFKPKTSKPMPHPEKSNVRKTKATKKKK